MIAIRLVAIEQDLAPVGRQVRPVGFDDTKCHPVDRQHAVLPGRDVDHVDGAVLVGAPARVNETAALSGRAETQPHERGARQDHLQAGAIRVHDEQRTRFIGWSRRNSFRATERR